MRRTSAVGALLSGTAASLGNRRWRDCSCRGWRHHRHFLAAGMTPQVFAYREDQYASHLMLALDAQGLSQIGPQWHITSSGVTPTTVSLSACKELSSTVATLERYLTSEDVSGDLDTAVGYARLWLA